MSFLKQVATRDQGANVPFATSRFYPNTEPTGTAYVAWKAKEYSAALMPGSSAGYRHVYGFGQMMKYHKILKREAKTNATRMAA
jgi:hypothetical protein